MRLAHLAVIISYGRVKSALRDVSESQGGAQKVYNTYLFVIRQYQLVRIRKVSDMRKLSFILASATSVAAISAAATAGAVTGYNVQLGGYQGTSVPASSGANWTDYFWGAIHHGTTTDDLLFNIPLPSNASNIVGGFYGSGGAANTYAPATFEVVTLDRYRQSAWSSGWQTCRNTVTSSGLWGDVTGAVFMPTNGYGYAEIKVSGDNLVVASAQISYQTP
jgi:hypothetical protein